MFDKANHRESLDDASKYYFTPNIPDGMDRCFPFFLDTRKPIESRNQTIVVRIDLDRSEVSAPPNFAGGCI